jgi:hypothetical protein
VTSSIAPRWRSDWGRRSVVMQMRIVAPKMK